jgi:hypothetical protein
MARKLAYQWRQWQRNQWPSYGDGMEGVYRRYRRKAAAKANGEKLKSGAENSSPLAEELAKK